MFTIITSLASVCLFVAFILIATFLGLVAWHIIVWGTIALLLIGAGTLVVGVFAAVVRPQSEVGHFGSPKVT